MKCLILCAGYGTRLQQGISQDPSGKYVHLTGLAKPLVPLGGIPLISRWVDILRQSDILKSDIYLVCNQYFYAQFMQWAEKNDFPIQNIWNDGTRDNESRLGAVKDIHCAVEYFNIQGNLFDFFDRN
jgi:NDP-sugar pyrophosphorylase family protein